MLIAPRKGDGLERRSGRDLESAGLSLPLKRRLPKKGRLEMKVVEVQWFSNPQGYIGIVIGEDNQTKERKAYISSVSGEDEAADTRYVLDWGAKFPLAMMQRLVDCLK